MKRLFSLLSLIVVLAAPVAAQSAAELFEQALVMERSGGDMDGAIALYEQVVRDHADNRDVAARALFRLGNLYEVRGEAKAKEAYHTLISRYGDQEELVSLSRERLAELDPPEEAPVELGLRTLTIVEPEGEKVHIRVPHPDGKRMLITLTNEEGEKWLALAPVEDAVLDGRRAQRIMEVRSNFQPWPIHFSPDGERIVYSHSSREKEQVRIREIDSGEESIVWSHSNPEQYTAGSEYFWLAGMEWSANNHLYVSASRDYYPSDSVVVSKYVIIDLDLSSGETTVHETDREREFYELCTLPSGDLIAHNGWELKNDYDERIGSVWKIDTSTFSQVLISDPQVSTVLMGCASDSEEIIVTVEEGDSRVLKKVPAGDADLPEREVFRFPSGIQPSDNSSYHLFVSDATPRDAYWVELNEDYEILPSTLRGGRSLTYRPGNIMGWLKDNETLVYGGTSGTAYAQDVESGSVKVLDGGFECCGTSRVSAFNDLLINNPTGQGGTRRVTMLYDVSKGAVVDSIMGHQTLAISSDGAVALAHQVGLSISPCTYLLDMATRASKDEGCLLEGQGDVLANVRAGTNEAAIIATSRASSNPDSVMFRRTQVYLLDMERGEIHLKGETVVRGRAGGSISWTPDGEYVFFTKVDISPEGSSRSLYRFSMLTRQFEEFSVPNFKLMSNRSFVLSNDGKKAGLIGAPSDIATTYWVLTGIDEALKDLK